MFASRGFARLSVPNARFGVNLASLLFTRSLPIRA